MLCLFIRRLRLQIRHTQQAGCKRLTAHVQQPGKKSAARAARAVMPSKAPQSTFIREESIIWDLKLASVSPELS